MADRPGGREGRRLVVRGRNATPVCIRPETTAAESSYVTLLRVLVGPHESIRVFASFHAFPFGKLSRK